MQPQAAATAGAVITGASASSSSSSSSSGLMLRAPSPDFSTLSPEELDRLELVLRKQVEIENEQSQRLAGLRRTMILLQQTVKQEPQRSRRTSSSNTSHNSSPNHQSQFVLSSSDIVQCYICSSTIEIQANSSSISSTILCSDCHRPICRRCGNYTSPEFVQTHYGINLENQSHTSKWRCRMCIVRREVVRKSGSWNMNDDDTPAHSPVRLLHKLAAFRTSSTTPSNSSAASPQIEHRTSILAESTNFFARFWRPSTSPQPTTITTMSTIPSTTTTATKANNQLTPSATLLASHEIHSSSFDNLPEPNSSSSPTAQEASVILSSSTSVNRRMSLIREVSSKNSVTPNPPDSSSLSMVPTISEPLQTQARLSSTITDPSFEDTTSEHPYDTASEIFSQSLDTNVDSSNPGMADDQHEQEEPKAIEKLLNYNGRHRRLSSSSPMIQLSSQKHSLFAKRNIEQHHSESQPSTEADNNAMDYFSISMLANTSTEPIFMENTSASIDIPVSEHLNQRRSSRSTLRNAHSWAQRRSVMQRSCQWTATLDRDNLNTNREPIAEYRTLNPISSLPASSSSAYGQEGSSSTPPHSPSPLSDPSSPIPSHILRRRRSSARRLPAIPADSIMQIDSSNFNEDLCNTSIPEYPIHPLRENSLSNRSTRSKSIDSESSGKPRLQAKLLQAHQTQNAKSVDISNLNRRKSLLAVNENLLPQRSLDYPYIVRKAQDLSDIVRRRMLYSKINKQQQGDNYSMSLERDHVPKVPRKIIIRQDNSIEIALSKPPKLRRQTLSEEYYYGYNPDSEFGISQTSNGSSMLGLPMSSSMSGSNNSDRRKTIETCENIYLHAEESSKLRARTPPANPHRILLHRDKGDTSIRTNGLGMRIIGGQECEDGSLGCFVTSVSPGGPADVQGNIEVGDQILEFNGNSLIDSTYEEVRMLQDQCGDIVQLVVQHNNIRFQINGGQTLSSIEVSRHFETVPRLSSSLTRKRRNLPPLPPSLSSTFPKQPKKQLYQTVEVLEVPSVKELKPILINRGRLLAQIWHDIEDGKLALTVIQASNLPLRPNGDQPYTYITGKMIFEDRGFDMFETKVIHSSNPIYNETFVFHDVDTVDVLRLEVLLWDKKQNTPSPTTTSLTVEENDEFIGMIQLPLNEANLDDEPRWYELRDRQARKPSATNVTFQSSSTERSDSFRKILPSFKSSKTNESTRTSIDTNLRTTTQTSALTTTNSRDISPKSILTNRKHSVVQMLNQPIRKRNLQRASIADPGGSSSIQISSNHRQSFANNNDPEEEEEEEEDDENENIEKYQKGGKRPSIIAVQSEKLRRRISNGLLKLFDTGNKRASEGTLRLPSSPTGRKLSGQSQLNTDSEEENDSPIGITIDNVSNSNNKSPRHSILSTTNPDDSRSLPLHQMPIGQLMLPYIPSSRHSSISGSRKSSAASYCDSDDDIDRYFTFCEQERQQQDALAETNNVHTHTVGPGQVTPRNYENMINDFIHMGQIQLGLIVTKGLLEIDVISARALQKVIEDPNNGTTIDDVPPDTYVKTYLRTGTRRVQKRKTTIVKANFNPEYHTKLKYNACNVMGRRLQVTVWQRARKFEKNQCIGEAFIQLDNLVLTQLTVAWYKLFREKLVESEFYDSS